MRLFAKLRPAASPAAVRTASSRAAEMLESRTLLNATLSTAIAPLSVASGSAATTVDLNAHFNDPTVTGTAVEIQTPLGNIPVALADARTPGTVANFKHYITSGEYNNVLIHRSAPGFVIQGGGYTPNGTHINSFGSITGEPGISNTAGTIAMALSNGPNSGTSEWFINLVNNNGTGSTPNLDNTSDGGPFTAFGNVVYNGMSVVNAIAALPVVADTQTTTPAPNAFGAIPAVNYTGPTTPTPVSSLSPSNMVVTNTVIVPALTYSVTSDNPSLLNAAVSGSTLSLTPGSGSGIANITVTATDLGGHTASTAFQVGVGVVPTTPVTTPLGAAGARQIRFTGANGTVTTLMLSGPGSATLNMNGTVASQSVARNKILTVTGTGLSIASITASGTTSASTLTITGHGGSNVVELSSLTDSGALRSLNAHNTDLAGDVRISGGVGSVNILSGTSGTLASTAIGHMVVKGAFADDVSASSIAGFTAGSITGGTWNVSGNVASVTAGSITNWTAHVGTLGKLTSKGAITNSTVHSTGNIGSVAASTLTGSTIFAGVATLPGGQALPAAASDFAASASISSLRTKTFTNSDVAAQTLGRFTLGQVTTANGGTPFGIAGHTIQALTAASAGKTLRLKNVASAADVAAALTASGLAAGDFLVRIV